MKAAELTQFGKPFDSVRCIETDDPGDPGAGEIVVRIDAAPINPAEILLIKGEYAVRPPLPAPLGIEGAGDVVAVGDGVTRFAVGDRVISLPRHNWRQQVLLKEDEAIALPGEIDIRQAAMLKINPATAYLMLRDYVALKPGDWVMQNAANSGVGTSLIKFAAARGLHTVNVVRRETAADYAREMSGDVAVIDGDDLADRVKEATGGADIKLAIDAVAGAATLRLANCLAPGGTIVNYGMLSGEPCMILPDQLVFESKSLTGFWLAKFLNETAIDDKRVLYRDLAQEIIDRGIETPVEAAYPLDQIKDAVDHATREGRGGKILVLPNG